MIPGTRRHQNLPSVNIHSDIGAIRGVVMLLAASLLVTTNDALVNLALGWAGSAGQSHDIFIDKLVFV